ncbi:pilus assembly protein PilM [Desulfurivibrio sp. D14AmB]|uniref:pilus assembly protein PilM n=1 Tax=Desulfurivibrio sp. D14AmB TaxID=3374370 RepID=UPI00376EAC74
MRDVKRGSSTEKLLEIIRGNSQAESSSPPVSSTASGGGKRIFSAAGKGPVVGVLVEEDALRLVRMTGPVANRRLDDCKSYPYPGNLTPAGETFPAFLKTSLQNFGVSAAARIWAVLPSDQLEVYPLRLPKASGRELSSAVYWAMQKEKRFNEQQVIFDYSLVGEVMDKGIPKLQVVCYLARREAVQALQRLYRRAGFALSGLSCEAAAINELLRAGSAAPPGESWAHVHLDREWSRIDLFSRHDFLFSRNIRTGSNSFVEAMVEESPTELSAAEAMARFEDKLRGRGEAGAGQDEELLRLITPALGRLANQIERTFEYFEQTLHFPRPEKLILSGGAALFPGLAAYLQEQLAIAVEILDPFVFAGPSLVSIHAPAAPRERILFAVPLGLALAEVGSTPNFLHTYREKEQARKERLTQRAAVVGMALLVGLALVFYGWQAHTRAGYQAELDRRQAELVALGPELSPQYLSGLLAQARKSREESERSLVRHKSIAVLGEVAAVSMAPNVRLHSLMIDAGDKGATGAGNLILDGFVEGNRQLLDSYLTGYIVRLQASGLFSNVRLQKTTEESYPGIGKVLKFTLSMQYG